MKNKIKYLLIVQVLLFISSVFAQDITNSDCIQDIDSYIEDTWEGYKLNNGGLAETDTLTYQVNIAKRSNADSLLLLLTVLKEKKGTYCDSIIAFTKLDNFENSIVQYGLYYVEGNYEPLVFTQVEKSSESVLYCFRYDVDTNTFVPFDKSEIDKTQR